MTKDPEILLAQAAQAMNQGDFTTAWACYFALVQAEPSHGQAWLGLGLCALLLRQFPVLAQLADRRQQIAGDGFVFVHDVLTAAMGYGMAPLIGELGAHLPDHSPYRVSQLYYEACAHLLRGDEDAAFASLGRLKPLLARFQSSLPIGPQDRFNVAYRQASLVEEGTYPDSLDQEALDRTAQALAPLREEGMWGGDGRGGDFVLLAACDGRYLDMFGADYLAALADLGQGALVHLHVVEPQGDTIARLSQGFLHTLCITSEGTNPWRGGAYFACSRFLVAPWVRRRHGDRPVMITDIDIRFRQPPAVLAQAAAGWDMASFVHDGVGPASRLPAVWTWFQGQAGAAALETLRRIILSKLHVGWPHNWMLDQAALITARRWLRRSHPQARIAEMNSVLGQGFDAYLECLGDEDEKAALISSAGIRP